MAVALSRPHRRLPFKRLLLFLLCGIIVYVFFIAGYGKVYWITASSLLSCRHNNYREHVSPPGRFTVRVRVHPSCVQNNIEIVNNQTGKLIGNLPARNWNTEPFNRTVRVSYKTFDRQPYCPCATRFARWENDSHFVMQIDGIVGRRDTIPDPLEPIYAVLGIRRKPSIGAGDLRGNYSVTVDAETGLILQNSIMHWI
jgi:hypothetical protein